MVSYRCAKDHPMEVSTNNSEKSICSICLTQPSSSGSASCSECQFSVCCSCCAIRTVGTNVNPPDNVKLENPQRLCQTAQELLTKGPAAGSGGEQTAEQPMELLQKALTIRQSVLGGAHPAVAETHQEIAKAWISQRYYAVALDYYKSALEVYSGKNNSSDKEAALQKEISQLIDTAVEAANYAMMQGMDGQARQQTSEALQQFEYAHSLLDAVLKHKGNSDAETKLNSLALTDVCRVLAGVHVSHSDYNSALAFLQQGHDILVTVLGKDDPRTMAMASDRNTVQKMARRPEEVEPVLQWFEQEDYNAEREAIAPVLKEDTGKSLAVSIDWLKRGFWKETQEAKLDPTATVQQVLEAVIQPKLSNKTQTYVNLLDKQHTGPTTLMLSYANESTIADIINTLDDYCRTQGHDDRTVFVWMECFCQTTDQKEKEAADDALKQRDLQARISKIGHVLAIMAPWSSPLSWRQPSCLQEIVLAQQTNGCKLTLVLPPAEAVAVSDALVGDPSAPIAQLYQALDQLELDHQRIFRPWIRNVIQAQVKEHCSSEEINEKSASSLSFMNGENDEQAVDVFKLQVCNKMGLMFWQYGEYKTALELLEDALNLTETMYGESHDSTATVYQNIANVLSDMGRYNMALETYLRALSVMEKTLPQHHPRIAGICAKLGNLYRITDALSKAMEYHQRALTTQIKLQGSSNNLACAECYKDLGNVFFSKGDNDAALSEFRKALGIQEGILEKTHPTLAVTHNQIGMVLETKGSYEGALKEYRTALSIQEEALGDDHVQTAMTHDNIASVLRCQDDWEGALEISTKVKEIYETSLGPKHPTTAAAWQSMGAVNNELDQVEDALESFHKALEIREAVLGMEHPLTAETLQSIGTLLFEIGDLDEALVELRKAFDILEPVLGIEHPKTKGLADAINAVLEA